MKKNILAALLITMGTIGVWAQAGVGKWMVFNGTSNFITVADDNALDIDEGEAYTITCKIRTSQWKNMPLFRKRDASNIGYEMTVGSNGNYAVNFRSTTNVNAGPGATVAPDLMLINTWYHLAVVVNPATNKIGIYINGVLKQEKETTTPNLSTLSFANAVDVTIGHDANRNPQRYFLGEMDDIRVWSKAFTEAELVSDMSAIVNNTTANLIAAWDFENVTGSTVPDVSGNGHTGIINGTVVLPVELSSFSAKAYGSNVHLEWSTASEKNNDFFEVERSVDGKNFSLVAKVAGAINSNTQISYRAIDENPLKGINYYRLKQTDLNGTSTYHQTIFVEVLTGLSLKLYPNPAQDFIVIDIPRPENLAIEIFDLNGKKYKVSSQAEGNQLIINTSNLNKGAYILKIIDANKFSTVHKILIDN